MWPKSNPLWLYSGGEKQIQGIRSGKQSAWRTMDRGSEHCMRRGNQNHPKEKEMQGKVVVWGGLKNTWDKKISKRKRRKGKTYPTECRVPENNKER